ncbi:hypothetical protein FB451DRAFT_1406212 [Mycena latifolia]|nr:hypothetical protein FB451DRAFT_1406212 [Mycena latifolia]
MSEVASQSDFDWEEALIWSDFVPCPGGGGLNGAALRVADMVEEAEMGVTKCIARKRAAPPSSSTGRRRPPGSGSGHPSSLSASSFPSLPSLPSLPPSLPSSLPALSHPASAGLPLLSSAHWGAAEREWRSIGMGGIGHPHPKLSLNAPPGQPFLYAQQQPGAGEYAFPSTGGGSPTFAGDHISILTSQLIGSFSAFSKLKKTKSQKSFAAFLLQVRYLF